MKPSRTKGMLRPQHPHRRHPRRGGIIVPALDLDATRLEEGPTCEVECILGYRFRNRRLLEEALTHSSIADSEHPSYQRLEHVGDAALNLAVTNHFFLTNPSGSPGQLSALRSANVSTEKLARVAVRHRLYHFLRRTSTAMDDMVNQFSEAVTRETNQGFASLPYGGATLKAPKVLADIVESVAAAVYVDCNFNLVDLWKVFRGLLEPIITTADLDEQPVSTLHELCQKHHKAVQFKHMMSGRMNITNVFIDGELVGVGASEQKVISKLNASRDALHKLYRSMPTNMDTDSVNPKTEA